MKNVLRKEKQTGIKMLNEPQITDLKRHLDERGIIDQLYNSDLPMEVKRIYRIKPIKGVKRGYHGHKIEMKGFSVIKGIVKFILFPFENSAENIKTFTLGEEKPQILIVPKNYYNGFVALEDNSTVLGFSNFTLDESLKDDFRLSSEFFGNEIWEIKNR